MNQALALLLVKQSPVGKFIQIECMQCQYLPISAVSIWNA